MFLYVNSIKKYNLLFYLLIGMDENENVGTFVVW
jgi:hypothetical protein